MTRLWTKLTSCLLPEFFSKKPLPDDTARKHDCIRRQNITSVLAGRTSDAKVKCARSSPCPFRDDQSVPKFEHSAVCQRHAMRPTHAQSTTDLPLHLPNATPFFEGSLLTFAACREISIPRHQPSRQATQPRIFERR